jgi:hypothetical protein
MPLVNTVNNHQTVNEGSLSSIEVKDNSKGEPCVTIKLYQGITLEDLTALQDMALETRRKMKEALGKYTF